jgi:hypothetical protein
MLLRVGVLKTVVALGAAAAAAALSVTAAHAFKGHDGRNRTSATAVRHAQPARLAVPGPERVPSITGSPPPPQPLTPPAQAPTTAAPAATPAPAPTTSGGS